MNKITMLLSAGLVVGMMTGCGVPQEKHDQIIMELESNSKSTEDSLNSKIADFESLLKSEKSKLSSVKAELGEASAQVNDLQAKNADTVKNLASAKSKVADLSSKLKSAKSAANAAKTAVADAESELSTLTAAYDKLKNRFEMYKKNMGHLNNPVKAPAVTPAEVAPVVSVEKDAEGQSAAEKAAELLEKMGSK